MPAIFKVIFDIFFSSVPFLKELKEKIFWLMELPNRKDLPVIADEKPLKRGDFDFMWT